MARSIRSEFTNHSTYSREAFSVRDKFWPVLNNSLSLPYPSMSFQLPERRESKIPLPGLEEEFTS